MLYYSGRVRVVDLVGAPVNNAKLNFYVTGTATPATVYTNSALTIPHTQPIRSNAAGFFEPIYLDPAISYKTVTTDENNATLPDGTVDPFNLELLSTSIKYIATAAENAVSVTPTNFSFIPGNPRRQGAPIDGVTSARAALFRQNSTGEQIYLTAGTYLVDSNLTISSAVWAESGAIFKVANGVTLSLTGPFDGSISQHFQLVGTGVVQLGTAANQTPYVPIKPVCPEFWGAKGINGPNNPTVPDDTAAVQACLGSLVAAGRPVVFNQIYPVTQIVLTGNELQIDFNGYSLKGIATVATKSVLDIKCGYSTLHNVRADANYNPLYECAIHWYTNNLNLYYPGFNRIFGMWPRNALIGLCIGALPSQSIPMPAQGTVQAEGVATDAPLSESVIIGFQTVSCVRSVYMTQHNGKMQFSDAVISGSHAGWTTYGSSGYTDATTCALVIRNDTTQASEIHMSGGSLEQNSETTGSFIQVTNGYLHCTGTIVEAQAFSYLAGNVGVTFNHCLDMGWNFGSNYSPWLVDTTCNGALRFSDVTISYPSGGLILGNGSPFVKGASNVAGTYSTNTKGFSVTFSDCELRDVPAAPLGGASGYSPTVQGVQARYKDCKYTSYDSTPAITVQYDIDDSVDLLANIVDESNYTITAYGANGNATSGGWTVATSNAGTCNWGSAASGITQLEKVIDTCFKLQAPAGETTTATSAAFNVQPQRNYILRGWITGGVIAATIAVQLKWFKFGGAASATVSTNMLSALDSVIGATALPFQFLVTVPKDATTGKVVLSAANGATMTITDISLGRS